MSSRTVEIDDEDRVMAEAFLDHIETLAAREDKIAFLAETIASAYADGVEDTAERAVSGMAGAMLHMGMRLGLPMESSIEQVELVTRMYRKHPEAIAKLEHDAQGAVDSFAKAIDGKDPPKNGDLQ
jgi:hypothetical protein